MKLSAAILSISLALANLLVAQTNSRQPSAAEGGGAINPTTQMPQSANTAQLEQQFFAMLRSGNGKKFLSYVPKSGVNVGPDAQHVSQADIEDQILHQRGIYCKLFDSACIQSEIQLDVSNAHVCSYRELLTKSKRVNTASSETTRNGVHQAILVARFKNDNCTGVGLIDFIFNNDGGNWALFSIP